MKRNLFYTAALLFAAVVLSGCEKGALESGEFKKGQQETTQGGSPAWNSADKALHARVEATPSARTDASGPKITSNAHSADFPGMLFIWDSKHNDNGYLKVDAQVFEQYAGFVLTAKEANTYWDFAIAPQDGQQMTADNAYVFYIPRVYNNKKINMVFFGGYVEKPEEPVIPPTEPETGPFIVTVLSGLDFGVEVARNNADAGMSFRDYWNQGFDRSIFDGIAAAAEREPAQWVWDDNNVNGVEGETVEFEFEVEVKGQQITASQLIFAGDNAISVWINGIFFGSTGATGLDMNNEISVLDGAAWNIPFIGNPKLLSRYFVPGVNTVKILARNAANATAYPELDPNNVDPAKDGYNDGNNAGGILFALLVRSQNPE